VFFPDAAFLISAPRQIQIFAYPHLVLCHCWYSLNNPKKSAS
jgi:hypothetical protein